MPCGGIGPIGNSVAAGQIESMTETQKACFSCGKLEPAPTRDDLFCDEWDAWLHRKCLPAFLASDDGLCVMAHGHQIFVPESSVMTELEPPPAKLTGAAREAKIAEIMKAIEMRALTDYNSKGDDAQLIVRRIATWHLETIEAMKGAQ